MHLSNDDLVTILRRGLMGIKKKKRKKILKTIDRQKIVVDIWCVDTALTDTSDPAKLLEFRVNSAAGKMLPILGGDGIHPGSPYCSARIEKPGKIIPITRQDVLTEGIINTDIFFRPEKGVVNSPPEIQPEDWDRDELGGELGDDVEANNMEDDDPLKEEGPEHFGDFLEFLKSRVWKKGTKVGNLLDNLEKCEDDLAPVLSTIIIKSGDRISRSTSLSALIKYLEDLDARPITENCRV